MGCGSSVWRYSIKLPLFSLFLLSFVLTHVPLYELCQILSSKWEALSWFLDSVSFFSSYLFFKTTQNIFINNNKKSIERSPIVRHCARFRRHTWLKRWLCFARCLFLELLILLVSKLSEEFGINWHSYIVWKTPALWKAVPARVSSHESFPSVGM